jgi:tRNA (guanine37-N1)-methyltransferase
MLEPVISESIIKRAQSKKKVEIFTHDLRNFSSDKHRKVDDRPFGGGSGMIMRPEPIFSATENLLSLHKGRRGHVVLLCPQGRRLDQKTCRRLSRYKHLILICGHYEGVDERVRDFLADEEISIGDFVLTGGELPAMVLIDAVVRLIPGVLGDKNSLNFESFEGNLLEYPQYTRPAKFRNMTVPGVLLSGNHKEIQSWRKKEAARKTRKKRPDMLLTNEKTAK